MKLTVRTYLAEQSSLLSSFTKHARFQIRALYSSFFLLRMCGRGAGGQGRG
jgi:hypothetical protein